MDYIRQILTKNILDLRRSKGLTQAELSEQIGFNYQTYGRWEIGTAWPDTASIEKLAAFYGISSSRFFYDPNLDLSSSPVIKTTSFDEKISSLDPVTKDLLEHLINGLFEKFGK